MSLRLVRSPAAPKMTTVHGLAGFSSSEIAVSGMAVILLSFGPLPSLPQPRWDRPRARPTIPARRNRARASYGEETPQGRAAVRRSPTDRKSCLRSGAAGRDWKQRRRQAIADLPPGTTGYEGLLRLGSVLYPRLAVAEVVDKAID